MKIKRCKTTLKENEKNYQFQESAQLSNNEYGWIQE